MASLEHLSKIINFDNTPEPVEDQVREAMRANNITPPDVIEFDGTIHRFSTRIGDNHDSAGWYILFGDNVPSGSFGDWREGTSFNFHAMTGRALTAADEIMLSQRIAEAKRIREQNLQQKRAIAAETVARVWERAAIASPDHEYLKRKNIQPHMARVGGDGRLMFPLYNSDGVLSSIQYVDSSGDKKYHPGGAVGSCFLMFGTYEGSGPIYLAEGFATAATIAEVMAAPTVAAYSAGNLPNVAKVLRSKYPTAEIVIVADNDANKTGEDGANKAAAESGARVVLIPNVGQDANDYHNSGGDLHSILSVKNKSWLISDDELCSQPAPIKWLIKGWIQDNALIMAHGPSGIGKTFVVLDWALHIAYLDQWNEKKISGGPVVYLAGEGHHGIRSRVAAWKQHHPNAGSGKFFLSRGACDLNNPSGFQSAISEIKMIPEKPRLVIIDTLHRFMAGDENSAQDAKTMIDACALIQREFECSVLLVHHTGVSEEAQNRARGSSAWRGALENEISIRPESGGLCIKQEKVKDAEKLEPIFFSLETVTIEGWIDDDGDPVTSAVVSISNEKPSTKAEIKKDVNEERDREILRRMIDYSEAEVTPDGDLVLTRSAMMRYVKDNIDYIGLKKNEGDTDAQINTRIAKYLDKGKSSSFLGRLFKYGIIRESGIDGAYLV